MRALGFTTAKQEGWLDRYSYDAPIGEWIGHLSAKVWGKRFNLICLFVDIKSGRRHQVHAFRSRKNSEIYCARDELVDFSAENIEGTLYRMQTGLTKNGTAAWYSAKEYSNEAEPSFVSEKLRLPDAKSSLDERISFIAPAIEFLAKLEPAHNRDAQAYADHEMQLAEKLFELMVAGNAKWIAQAEEIVRESVHGLRAIEEMQSFRNQLLFFGDRVLGDSIWTAIASSETRYRWKGINGWAP